MAVVFPPLPLPPADFWESQLRTSAMRRWGRTPRLSGRMRKETSSPLLSTGAPRPASTPEERQPLPARRGGSGRTLPVPRQLCSQETRAAPAGRRELRREQGRPWPQHRPGQARDPGQTPSDKHSACRAGLRQRHHDTVSLPRPAHGRQQRQHPTRVTGMQRQWQGPGS